MEKIVKAKNTYFAIALTMSILAVLGIPMIVFGAIFSGVVMKIVMSAGIAFTGIGFYAIPFLWIGFGGRCTDIRMLNLINNEHYYNVNEIAVQLNMHPQVVVQTLQNMIKREYLVGYFFDGNNLILNTREKQGQVAGKMNCPNCGATMVKNRCEHCGTIYR